MLDKPTFSDTLLYRIPSILSWIVDGNDDIQSQRVDPNQNIECLQIFENKDELKVKIGKKNL